MTTWMPVFNGVECGCEIQSNDGQSTFVEWKKCSAHQDLDFKGIKKLAIDENISGLEVSGLYNADEIQNLRNSFYSAHGIEDVG